MLVLALLVPSLSCRSVSVRKCPDNVLCPSDKVCDPDLPACIFPDQRSVCDDKGEGESCSIAEIPLGRCSQGLCFAFSCGNESIELGEECDGVQATQAGSVVDLDSLDCTDLGYYEAGPVSCSQTCTFSGCGGGFCGDGIKNGPEFCDGDLPREQCVDLGFDFGNSDCHVCGLDLRKCRRIGWTPLPTVSSSLGVRHLWARSGKEIWVGTGGCESGELLLYDGEAWQMRRNFAGGVAQVWGAPPADLWVLVDLCPGAEIWHHDGTAWSLEWSDASSILWDLWASSSDNVWAVGANSDIIHYDGNSWSRVSVPGMSGLILGVSGFGDEVWLTALSGTVAHFDGGNWSTTNFPSHHLRAVHAPGSGEAWVVGNDITQPFVNGGKILHHVGGNWSAIATGGDLLDQVHGSGDLVWFGGQSDELLMWNQGHLRRIPSNAGGSLVSIFAPSESEAYFSTRFRVSEFAGALWLEQPFYGESVVDVWAQGQVLWSLTQRGIWRTEAGDSNFTDLEAMFLSVGSGLWGSDEGELWVAGEDKVLHFDGITWTISLNEPANILWGLSKNALWAAGTGVHHWDGADWTQLPTPPHFALDLWASGPNDLWIIGGQGELSRYDGQQWSAVPSGTTERLHAIWGSAPDNIWVVGDSGTLLHFDGNQVTPNDETRQRLRGVWGRSSSEVWAVGTQTLLHFDGSRWGPVRSPGTTRGIRYTAVFGTPTDLILGGEDVDDAGYLDHLFLTKTFGQ